MNRNERKKKPEKKKLLLCSFMPVAFLEYIKSFNSLNRFKNIVLILKKRVVDSYFDDTSWGHR